MCRQIMSVLEEMPLSALSPQRSRVASPDQHRPAHPRLALSPKADSQFESKHFDPA
ncbi:hypothetical protein BCEN4_850017 [Burkholderia cenocepacia]|nr:hypothetical protein BCEN4_850017 [Burkholderia cenocepacia]